MCFNALCLLTFYNYRIRVQIYSGVEANVVFNDSGLGQLNRLKCNYSVPFDVLVITV